MRVGLGLNMNKVHPMNEPAPEASKSESGECKQETNPPPTDTASSAPASSSTTPEMPPPTGALSNLVYMELIGLDHFLSNRLFEWGTVYLLVTLVTCSATLLHPRVQS